MSQLVQLINFENYKVIFEEILGMTEDGFVVTDVNGNILEINKAYCDFLGTTKQDAIGKHIKQLIPNSKMTEIATSGKKEVEVIHKLIDGKNNKGDNFLLVTRGPVKKDGKIIGAVAQVKFRLHTIELANKIMRQDEELKYYKDELVRLGKCKFSFENMIGNSDKLIEVKEIALKASKNSLPVLITGETGTGKEVFANSIHYQSVRKNSPLITINCAAIPAELLEAELFGYEEGSFTGAKKGGKKGKFELANKGTLFLDEIGDMPMHMQAKLLRVLQENEVEKIGGNKPIPIDVRIISATHQDLKNLISEKKFREDLYYRLNVINLKIPPLRQRKPDIFNFIDEFLGALNRKYRTNTIITEKAMELLINHNWPGNIRELKNVVESAYALSDDQKIGVRQLPSNLLTSNSHLYINAKNNDLEIILNEFERQIILDYLIKNNYKITKTANELGIHRTTLYKKLSNLNIEIIKNVSE